MAHADTIEHEGSPSHEVILSIGSNCGDRQENVRNGLKWLSGMLSKFRCSLIYATPDCHGGPRKYMNAVAIGLTPLSAQEIEGLCKQFEIGCGRNDFARAVGDVPMDIDLVIYNEEIIREKDFRSEFFIKGYEELKALRESV